MNELTDKSVKLLIIGIDESGKDIEKERSESNDL